MHLKDLFELNLEGEFRESVIKDLPAPSTDEYQRMKADIAENGIQVPILITKDNLVVDGYHRVKAAKELGVNKVPCEIIDEDLDNQQLIDRAILLNMARRQLSPEQKQVIIRRLREKGLTQKEIEQKTGISQPAISRSQKKDKSVNNIQMNNTHAPDLRIRIPVFEYESIARRIENGETQKQVADDYKVDRSRISQILKTYKKRKQIQKQKEKIKKSKLKIPQDKYDIIVVDPPWPYGTPYNAETRRVGSPYPEMSLDEIREIKLPAADDCILWLWTTHKFIRDAFHLLDYWGFEHKMILTWKKNRMGMGRWLRSITEFCIMAAKGSPEVYQPDHLY